MPQHREPLSGGLVTSRHASLLEPGELTTANDSRYRPNNPAIRRAWGRTRYINSNGQIGGGAAKVKGSAFCPFDPSTDGASDNYLVAHLADKYYVSVFTGRTGTISGTSIDNVGTGTHLDVCHAGNKWFLFNGNTEGVANRVLKPGTTNPTSRRHGLVPVAVSPANPSNPVITTSAGSWPLDEAFWGEGRFFFFTTEVVSPGGADELESAFTGTPPFVDLQKDGSGSIALNVTVRRHDPLANSTATEVRVYMVKANLNQAWDNSLLARAFRVGTISVTGTAANDKITLSDSYTVFNSTTAPTIATVSGTISNASNMGVQDDAVASVANGNTAVVDLTNWGFSVPAGAAILGMKMWIRYRSPGTGFASISAQFRFGAGPTLGTAKLFTTTNDDFVMHQQPWPSADTDTWGLTLVGSDVNSTNFGVRLTISASGVGSITNQIDVVKIQLYTAVLPSIGPAYPIVALQEGNVLTIHHANLPPPVASTGDVHDGQLVTNVIGNDREIAYSLPGKYDYFPAIYRIAFDTKEKDKVQVIRRVGDVLVAFLLHQIQRVNYLPLTVDPEFNTGRAYEEITSAHGCVSAQGVATFAQPDGSTLAGYVSGSGIFVTNGQNTKIVSEDIDWEATVDVTQLSKAVLLNYQKEHVLVFHYIAAGSGATENNRYLLLHYHPSHQKEGGRFKITGPNVMKAASGCVAKLLAEPILIVGHTTDARFYVEDNGNDDAEGTGINFQIETREHYPGGPGTMVTEKFAWWHVSGTAAAMTATSTPKYRNGVDALASVAAETFTPSAEGLVLLQHHFGIAEAIRHNLSVPDAGAGNNAAFAATYLVYDLDQHGKAQGD